jgi:hypothetical protein
MIFFSTDEYIIGPGIDLGSASGEINDGVNIGTGFEIYAGKTGVTLQFRTVEPLATDFDTVQTATNIVFKLNDTGVTPGTYPNATVNVDSKGRIQSISAGTSIDQFRYFQAECMASPNSTPGYFTRATNSQNNPGGLALTQPWNIYQNGLLTPWLIQGTWEIVDIKVLCAAAAISISGTPSTTATFRLDLYQINVSNRTLISTQRLPCIANADLIGQNNNLSPATTLIYFAKSTFDPVIQPANSTLFGFEFINESGSVDVINGFSRATAHIIMKKI